HENGARGAGAAGAAGSRSCPAARGHGGHRQARTTPETFGLGRAVILVDTNAWVHHLRRTDPRLVQFLLEQRVRTCDVVIGELGLGAGLPLEFSPAVRALPKLPSPTAAETRAFIERHRRTWGASGLGWADAQIVLSAMKSGARVHTADRAVKRVCR